jgi:Flp pilus assembly pilin Flp
MIRRLLIDESGSSMVEEALILAVMVIAVMAGVMAITNTLQGGILGTASAIGDAIPAS